MNFHQFNGLERDFLPRLPRIFIVNWAAACCSAADSILRLARVPAARYELQLILSCCWLELQRLDTTCGWFYPMTDSSSGGWFYPADDSNSSGWIRFTADSSSSGWIRVVADPILELTRVLAAGYELWLIPSHSLFEFQRLDRSYGWLHHTVDSSSSSWTRVTANSKYQLSQVPTIGYELWLTLSCDWRESQRLDKSYSCIYPATDYELQLILSCDWLKICRMNSTCDWLIL